MILLIILGVWGDWSLVEGSCTVSCGQGTQTRARSCSEPGVDQCLHLDGVTRSMEEVDATVTCSLASCEGKWLFI